MRRIVLALAVPFALVSARTLATTFMVDTLADTRDANPGDQVCADADGACSLRAAIEETNALAGPDTIELGAGVHALAIAGIDEDASASGDLDASDDLAIEGQGEGTTVIDGGALDRVLDLHAGSLALHGLSIRNGLVAGVHAEPAGAALRVGAGVAVELEHVVIEDNTATVSPGGVAIDSAGCITGSHVRVLDNHDSASTGSAFATGTIVVRGTGAACFELEDSEISGNSADYAGAIYADGATITLRRTLLSDNEARFAGAILPNSADTVTLENVTISGNRGTSGAIANDGGSTVTLVNCTVTGNGPPAGLTANVGGLGDVHGGFGLTFLSNTIVSGNGPGFIADDCDRGHSVGGGNLIGDSARCHFDADPSDQFDVDPGLGPLADNGGFTRTHLAGAAAIDHGVAASACPATDQRGAPRPVDGDGDGTAQCDSGAVERQIDAIFASGFEPA